jgi:hypothetical protein
MLRWLLYRLNVYLQRSDRIDKFKAHPKRAFVLELVAKGRWQEFQALYASLRQDERHVVTSGLAQAMEAGAFDRWVAAEGSAVAHSMKGHLELDLAWRARTAVIGSLVREEAWKKFHAHLRTAYENLRAASEIDSSDPEPFCAMIRSLMGLGDYVPEMHDCFNRVEGTHLPAASYLLDALTEKWHGSHAEMFAFARSLYGTNAGYGSVVALAHVERWFAAVDHGDKEDRRSYFAKPDIREEIIEAYERDALLDDRELSYFALIAHSVYGFVFWKMNDRARASRELDLIGPHITEKPWAYGGFRRFGALKGARKDCGLPAFARVV